MRRPNNNDSLKLLKSLLPNDITSVIDVGVQYSTPFLMECFPDAYHYLIEPVSTYREAIVENYSRAGIAHELIESAASDTPGMLYQHLQSLDGSGKITHSQLLGTRTVSLPGLVNIVATPVITLDSMFSSLTSHLVKIDVDGIEEKIIQGGKMTIERASVVVVEAPIHKLTTRAGLLEEFGMQLFDITDMCYYYSQLQQVDLIFVNKAIIANNLDFHPMKKHQPICWAEWCKL